jgi:DNA polymerase elongation subunit (family B)
VFQQAWKVLANSLFGAAGNPGFIFFDNRIAEGITMTGQYVIRYVGNYCDEKFNKFFSTDSYKYNIYQDTDSCYFTFGNVVKKYYSGKTDLQITSALDRLMEQKLRTFINESTDIISARQNYYKSTMFFKRETISSSGFWMAPKKYALKIYDSEGVIYQNGDYKIMGIEVVRSSTPEMVREDLRTCVQRIIDRDEGGVHQLIQNVHNQFMVEDIDRISSPRSASDVVGYSSDESDVTDSEYLEDFSGGVAYKSRTPIHVRGAILYNEFIKKNDLTYKYPLLDDGDKLKFTYLKMPNPIKENVIAYVDKLPEEMGLEKYVDREMRFEKTFMGPVIKMFEAVGWKIDNEENPLEALFG